jgi:dihydroxyacetone kinase
MSDATSSTVPQLPPEECQAPALLASRCLAQMLARVSAAEAELGRLDAQVGDGDHGAGMVRGLRAADRAATDALEHNASAGALLVQAGSAFADEAGGASGALVGTLLLTVGRSLGEGPVTPATVAAALDSGLQQLCTMGKAQPGDKTLVDTLDPFVRALREAVEGGASLATAWHAALPAAEAGAASTADMVARRGRSARLGERSRGHLDPGAVSALLMLQAVGEALGAA